MKLRLALLTAILLLGPGISYQMGFVQRLFPWRTIHLMHAHGTQLIRLPQSNSAN
jgi:hypothetical protein